MKRILFVDTGREYGGGTKSFLYLLRGLAAQGKYELCAFFEHDYEALGRKISQIIEEAGAKFIEFAPKKQPSKLKKELLRALGGQILAKYLYAKDYEYALCLLRQTRPDIVHLNNHFSTNLAYIAAANALNIAVVQHLRKNSPVEPFKLEILKRLKFTPICVSNATYEFYAAQLKMPKNVVYNPVEAPILGRQSAGRGEKFSACDGDKNFNSRGEILCPAPGKFSAASAEFTVGGQNCYVDDADKICVKFDGVKASDAERIYDDTREASQICGEEKERNLTATSKFDERSLCAQNHLNDLNLTAKNAFKQESCESNLGSAITNLNDAQSVRNSETADKNAKLKAKFDPQKINIVMPANFLTLKGHELVFDALAGLKRRDVKVYFAGGGELKAGAKAKFDALIKSDKAEYLGFVSKMDEIYAACDYVLGFSSDEGLPRVVIEALGCGLGVIYSDIAVIREIYEISSKKQDFFIVQRDAAALLACLEDLRKPSSKSPDDAVIKAFSIENYLREIDRIYSAL